MQQEEFKVYKYRWLLLTVYMLIVAINQWLWITFAPITKESAHYYQVSDLQIGLLSMSFMIVFILASLPASWIIDKFGIRLGVGTGALLTGIFGLTRGFAGDNYNFLLISQIGIAVGQPFLLNAITKLAARWFPIAERATASGLGTLSMYLGILAGMIATPYLVIGYGIATMLYILGVTSAIVAAIFLIIVREKPPTPPCPAGMEERALVTDGFRQIFRTRDFYWLMLIFFIGLGVFNCVTTWIENILIPRGFTAEQAGLAGGSMIAGGILGALILPPLSDRFKKRTPFIIIALAGASFGLVGLTFSTNYSFLLISSVLLGFFLLSSGPIGFQYGAEITYPASEGASNGLLLQIGQISGIAMIIGMDYFKSPVTGSMKIPLLFLIAALFISLFLSFRLKESKLLISQVEAKDDKNT
ncbi:MAG TPA: MFS transporter [Bacteroidales bacterium]|jgi:cyanate permease|nr:MFS transporter [Bacteroidales bacterium]